MPAVLLGELAEIASVNVPRLTGIVRWATNKIPSAQFTEWSLDRIIRDLALTTPIEASTLLQFALEGISTAEQLWNGTISAMEAASRAPMAVLERGIGGGLQTFVYRVVYTIGLAGGDQIDYQSVLVDSRTPLNTQELEQAVRSTVESPRQPVTMVGGLGPDFTSVVVVGIDFMLVLQ